MYGKRIVSWRMMLISVLVASLSWADMARAYVGLCCGKCGGNMPMNIPGGGVPETHEYRVKFSPMRMKMEGLRDGSGRLDSDSLLGMPVMMGRPTGKFMAVPTSMAMDMLNITAGYSFTDDLFGAVMLMYKRNSMDMRFNDMMKTQVGREGFVMKSSGVADTMLMGKYRLFADDPLIPSRQMSLLFGFNLPTGSIDQRNTDHPVPTRQQELQPYGMQLGSGTVDPSLGLLYQRSASPWWWGMNARYTARLYDNKRGYRLGDEAQVDVYAMFQFHPQWLIQAQINASHQTGIRGEMDEYRDGDSGHATPGDPNSPATTLLWNTDNYGGSQVFATFGVQWQPVSLHILDLNVGVPLYRNLNGPQLEQDYRVMLTWYIEFVTKSSRRYGMGKTQPNDSRLGF